MILCGDPYREHKKEEDKMNNIRKHYLDRNKGEGLTKQKH